MDTQLPAMVILLSDDVTQMAGIPLSLLVDRCWFCGTEEKS